MYCPHCKSILKATKYRGITIHECPSCKGKWFSGNELFHAIEKKDYDIRWMNFCLFEENGKKYAKTQGNRLCPEDKTVMIQMAYNDSNVIIDKCETCGGIWLDEKEFEKIIRYLERLIITETASEYAKDAWKHFVEIGTLHDDITSEIQDLLILTKLFQERLLAEHPWMNTVILKTLQYVPYN